MLEISLPSFPRYISPAVGETEINLAATRQGLKNIENAIQGATGKHDDFLNQLRLPALPSARCGER